MSHTGFQITHSVPLTNTESDQLGPLREILLTCYTIARRCWQNCSGFHVFIFTFKGKIHPKLFPTPISDGLCISGPLQCLCCLFLILLRISRQMLMICKKTQSTAVTPVFGEVILNVNIKAALINAFFIITVSNDYAQCVRCHLKWWTHR